MASVPLALDGTLGDIQIALVLATFLYGIETLQTFNYYREFPQDPLGIKALVAGIWLVELGHTMASWHAMYTITVTFYGQPQHILDPPSSLVYPVLFHAIIALTVQSYFVYRVRLLSGQWVVPILCCALNIVRLVFNIILFVKLNMRPQFNLLTTEFNSVIIILSSTAPAVDVIVAGSLVYFLWNRKRTSFKQTSQVLDSIILWTVETTCVTTLSGVMQLILFLTRRNDLSWLVFFLIQAKLFSNSMLASLNGRRRFRAPNNPQPSSHLIALDATVPGVNSVGAIRLQQQMTVTTHEDIPMDSLQKV
ncbi:hypothetical protein FB451DRAFT_1374420 [Mycena latifolia]|nr:hypothetical protein FB451DRAFT_1374420 [Mycena latifolia]